MPSADTTGTVDAAGDWRFGTISSGGQLLLAITAGAALLALWCYVRWPSTAPPTLRGAVLRALIALPLLQVAAVTLGAATGRSRELTLLALLVVVLGALTYAFLATLWVFRLFADALKGFV